MTKAVKKVTKKVTKKTNKVVKKVTKNVNNNTITMTLKQANTLRLSLEKAGKTYKFLDTKINAVNA